MSGVSALMLTSSEGHVVIAGLLPEAGCRQDLAAKASLCRFHVGFRV